MTNHIIIYTNPNRDIDSSYDHILENMRYYRAEHKDISQINNLKAYIKNSKICADITNDVLNEFPTVMTNPAFCVITEESHTGLNAICIGREIINKNKHIFLIVYFCAKPRHGREFILKIRNMFAHSKIDEISLKATTKTYEFYKKSGFSKQNDMSFVNSIFGLVPMVSKFSK